MKDKRQGNDLKVAWSIFKQDGEPFRLEGLDVSLYLKNMFGRKELNDFVVTGNIIQWTFYGKDQKNTGKYSLEMVINEGEKGMITTDKCNFVNLVPCTCKLQGGEDDLNVETESIELTSTLEYVAGGGSGDSIIVEGDAPSSALIKGTYAEATNEAATAFGGVESFLYHEGEDDERTIEVPNPTTASGLSAHAEGIGAIASGVGAHAEGNVAITHDYLNEDTGEYEQTIIVSEASGRGAHAEGLGTKSTKSGSHSEGIGTEVNANSGHGEGYYTKVHSGEGTHTEGMQTDGIGNGAHAEGYSTFAKGTAAHAEGRGCVATEYGAHVEGGYLKEGDVKLTIERQDDPGFFRYKITSPSSPNIIAGLGCNLRDGSHVIIEKYEGVNNLYLSKEVEDGTYIFSNVASGTSSHSEGALNVASGKAAHAEGLKNVASGPSSHVEGEANTAGGDCSHVEGYLNETTKTGAHIEGRLNRANAIYSHVEGVNNNAEGDFSHTEGVGTCHIIGIRSGKNENKLYELPSLDDKALLSVGDKVYRNGYSSVSIKTIYGGDSKWIELSDKIGHIRPYDEDGNLTFEKVLFVPMNGDQLNRTGGASSHVEGVGTQTSNYGESAVGRFNETKKGLIFSVGNGTSNEDRKNVLEVYESGAIVLGEYDYVTREEFSDSMGRYALADDLQELSERVDGLEGGSGSSATPDWDASEGEEGFIKNRTHYKRESVDEYGVEDVYWDEDDGGNFHLFNIEVNPDKKIDSVNFSCSGKKSKDIIIADNEIDFETSIEISSKEIYRLQGTISISDYGKYKGINITARCNYELWDLTVNINDITLVKLPEEYIPESIARKSELTELSSQVSGLSERVDELGEGGSSVFVATHGETTLQEIKDAIAAKKVVVCYFDNKCYVLSIITSNDVTLVASKGNYLYALACNYKNEWNGAAYIYSHELNNLANGNVQLTIAGKSAEVATPREWKCVYDGRMEVGIKKLIFTTLEDGTPLKADEVIVQILNDKTATTNITGYVVVQSTTNKTRSMFGSVNYESSTITEGKPLLNQIRLKASPHMYMLAEMDVNVKQVVASPTQRYVQGGNASTFQIYEDIVSVELDLNSVTTSAAPYIKIYAR